MKFLGNTDIFPQLTLILINVSIFYEYYHRHIHIDLSLQGNYACCITYIHGFLSDYIVFMQKSDMHIDIEVKTLL